MLAVAEMYIKGVSTREVEAVMREFGIESLSSSQVSRAAKLLDEELAAWRDRPLGEVRTSSSTRATRRCATAGSCATSPCSRPSASARTSAGGFWACRWPCRRPRSTGGVPRKPGRSRAARDRLRRLRRPWRPARRPARCSRRRTWHRCQFHRPETPSITPQRPNPQTHRQTAEIDLAGGRSQQGRNRPDRAGRQLPRQRAQAGSVARGKRSRRPRRLHPA